MRRIILKKLSIDFLHNKTFHLLVNSCLALYIAFFLTKNIEQYVFLTQIVGLDSIYLILLCSLAIHLIILPNRMWSVLKVHVDPSFSFRSYLPVHSHSYLFTVSPLGIIGYEINRALRISWKAEITSKTKFHLLIVDRLLGLLTVLVIASYFIFPILSICLAISFILLLVLVRNLNQINLTAKKSIYMVILSAIGFVIYSLQIDSLLSNLLSNILFKESLIIASILIISAIMPFSFLGLSFREIAFQQILINMGLEASLAMKVALIIMLCDLIINIIFFMLYKLIKKRERLSEI